MLNRAAIVTVAVALALLSASAFGASSQRFTVGAVVVRSATVTSSVGATVRDGVHVQQVASRGTPMPMLLAADGLKPMPQSGAAQLSAGSSEDVTVTVLY
jgi:plasmid stability protein